MITVLEWLRALIRFLPDTLGTEGCTKIQVLSQEGVEKRKTANVSTHMIGIISASGLDRKAMSGVARISQRRDEVPRRESS
jgi:hypothetical protein